MQRMLTLIAAIGFVSIGAWSILNQDVVDTWIVERNFPAEHDEESLLGLQENETWLVLVVDFSLNPADGGWGPNEAENLLAQSASDYFHQVSGNMTNVDLVVHPDTIRASNELAYYGGDSSSRDVNDQGTFMPSELAMEAVESIGDTMNWSQFDLDDDGTVDRLLILHTTKGQEESPGIKNRIWSHFTHFDSPINVKDGYTVEHYTMASLQTGTSGIGTIIHEMMHQMGAVDLYPVHDDAPLQAWNGVGDWDIMASGNWNGGGRWPALPTGPSMELIGAGRSVEMDLTWPKDTTSPCVGPTTDLSGTSEAGDVLKIKIGDEEYIFIEMRTDSGYDSRLPGHGILVTYQDLTAGDLDQNEVNTNPEFPYVMVIEADGGQELVSGTNSGEETDLFKNGTKFGAQGITIKNHDGVYVDWTATVTGDNHSTVSFTSDYCSPAFDIGLPDYSATILPGQPVPIELNHDVICTSNLTASDGRIVNLVYNETTTQRYQLKFEGSGMTNSLSIIEGRIQCGAEGIYVIEYPVLTLNRIPIETQFTADISSSENTKIRIPVDSVGNNSQRISVKIDGPLGRIGQGSDFLLLQDDAYYELEVTPNGLLTDNMLVRGELIMYTDEGGEWTVSINLNADDNNPSYLDELRTPGRVIGVSGILIGAYLLLTLLKREQTKPKQEEVFVEHVQPARPPQQPSVTAADPWGRPIDTMSEYDSLGPLDVEKFP